MRLFGTQKLVQVASAMNLPDDVPIDMGLLSNNIEKAQKRIESKYYNIRKNVLEYDEVLARQRDIVYDERYKIMAGEIDYISTVKKMMKERVEMRVMDAVGEDKKITNEHIEAIKENFQDLRSTIQIKDYSDSELARLKVTDLITDLSTQIENNFEELSKTSSKDFVEDYSKRLLLFLLDGSWQEHMVSIDELKRGIGLRAYAQTDPLQAFKTESFELFDNMMNYIKDEVLKTFMGLYETICLKLLVRSENVTHAETSENTETE
jgi:preprotein translocase subunit SecA